jgi:hypothetical protein
MPVNRIEYQKRARIERDHRAQPGGIAATTANAMKSP